MGQQVLQFKGNGSVEFLQKLQNLLPKAKAQVVILPTRTPQMYGLVRPYQK